MRVTTEVYVQFPQTQTIRTSIQHNGKEVHRESTFDVNYFESQFDHIMRKHVDGLKQYLLAAL